MGGIPQGHTGLQNSSSGGFGLCPGHVAVATQVFEHLQRHGRVPFIVQDDVARQIISKQTQRRGRVQLQALNEMGEHGRNAGLSTHSKGGGDGMSGCRFHQIEGGRKERVNLGRQGGAFQHRKHRSGVVRNGTNHVANRLGSRTTGGL